MISLEDKSTFFTFELLVVNAGRCRTFASLAHKSSTKFPDAISRNGKKADTKYLIDQQRFEV